MLWIGSNPCVLRVGVIGINSKTANLSLREAIARGAESLSGERGLFFPHPTVLLSTCNRTEIYFSCDDLAEGHSALLAWLRDQIDESFEVRLYSYFGIDCFAHLCRVSAGLDSAILAETEIQRQVKIAYQRSSERSPLPSSLHYVFQKGLKVGKTVRSQLELERGSPTLYSTIWQIGESVLGDLRKRRILLVGHSEINRGFSSFLTHKKVTRFTLCTQNPSSVRLEEARICDRSELSRWQEYDFIVCASRASDYLIGGASPNSHLIVDLSVPRNVDPEVEKAPAIRLFNIEQLNCLIEQKRRAQTDCLEKCESLIWQNVVRLARNYRIKTQHGLESVETGLRLEYSPSL